MRQISISALLFSVFGLACGGETLGPARSADSVPPGPEPTTAAGHATFGQPEFPAADEPDSPLVDPKQPSQVVHYTKNDRPTIRCEVMWRASVVADPGDPKLLAQKTERLELLPGTSKRTKLGPFSVRADYQAHAHEGDALLMDVRSHAGDSSRQMFQFDGRVMQRPGPSGFTGLVYRTLPNQPDELQYWCALAG